MIASRPPIATRPVSNLSIAQSFLGVFRRAAIFLCMRAWFKHSFANILTFALALTALVPCVRGELWSTAYYAGWMQGQVPASRVDFTALSHIIHFSVLPNPNGSLDSSTHSLFPANSADLLTRAHAAGRKVLISVGGADTQAAFQSATTPTTAPFFISNLVQFARARGYDGIDIDWEPLDASDAPQFTNFVRSLRSALNSIQPRPLLTAATASQPALFASLKDQLDQINLMTYDLSGPWSGWITWFNAPIYSGNTRFPSTGGLVPSADGMVNDFIAAGVPPAKLGVGIAFYGVVWSAGTGTTTGGAAQPRQAWTTPPTTTAIPFDTIMSSYFQPQRYRWDAAAQAAYLTIEEAGSANDKFISYDDVRACQSKVSYARNRGLGGVMIWELGTGYRSTQPEGQRDPLLQAIKQALAPTRLNPLTVTNDQISLSFTGMPLAQYRVQWTSNALATNWSSLPGTLSSTGGIIQLNDPIAPLPRFYRVKTPP